MRFSMISRGLASGTALLAAVIALGCKSLDEHGGSSVRNIPAVVEPEALPELLDAGSGVIVLDARDRASFEVSHLPRARLAPANDWNTAAREGTGLADHEAWGKRIAALGIDGDSRVLVYDAGSMTDAARVWFILQHAGVTHVGVLNGGLKGASSQLASIPLERGPAQSPVPSDFQIRPASGDSTGAVGLADKSEMKALVQNRGRVILDTRSSDEYSGVALGKNPRGGHLPGAVSLPHTEFYDQDGLLKPPGEVAALLRSRGIQPGTPFTVHCQGGGRS